MIRLCCPKAENVAGKPPIQVLGKLKASPPVGLGVQKGLMLGVLLCSFGFRDLGFRVFG